MRFIVLDKVSSFIFAVAILIFVFMWVKAISMEFFDNVWIVRFALVASVAVAVVMLVVTIVYSIQASSTVFNSRYCG